MITGPVLCACFRAVFVSRVCLVCGYCVARCLTCGLVEAPQSARSPARSADHTVPPNLSALCGGVLLSCLGVHVGELFRVTNVVNLSNILCASWAIVTNVVNPPVISPEIGYFGLDLTTFVTSGVSDVWNVRGIRGFSASPGLVPYPWPVSVRYTRNRLSATMTAAMRKPVTRRGRLFA